MTREDRKKDVSDEFIYLAISDAYSLIDKIYNDFEQQLKIAQSTIEAQEIVIAELKEIHSIDSTMFIRLQKRIEELEAPRSCDGCENQLKLCETALDEAEKRAKELEAPKSCYNCKHYSIGLNIHGDIKYESCLKYVHTSKKDFYCSYYEPKDKQ